MSSRVSVQVPPDSATPGTIAVTSSEPSRMSDVTTRISPLYGVFAVELAVGVGSGVCVCVEEGVGVEEAAEEEGVGEGFAPRIGVAQADSVNAPSRRTVTGSATRARLERDRAAVWFAGFTRSLCVSRVTDGNIVRNR